LAVVVLLGLIAQCGREDAEAPTALSAAPATTTARAAQPLVAAPRTSTAPATPPTTTRPPRTTTAAPTTTAESRPDPQPRPNPQPAPQPAPDTEDDEASENVYYENCDAVRAAGAAPIRRGEPGYRSGLDRDGDGEGCGSD
jgi:hypothetical protein